MVHLAESIFTESYNLASITNDDILSLPFNFNFSIVITGLVSSGKRSFAKKFITNHASSSDIILYSSPFNINLPITILDNMRFIARGGYGTPHTKHLLVCIFDYELATPEVKDFVSAFLVHHAISS